MAGHADAGGDGEFFAGVAEAVAEGARDALGQRLGHGGLVARVGDHQELVAAEPRQQAGVAHAVLEAARRADQHVVARGVAQQVVHQLEAVQVDVDHRGAALVAAQAVLQLRQDAVAVEQAGQRISARLAAQGFLDLPSLRDVLHGAGEARGHRRAALGLADQARPQGFAVQAHHQDLQVERAAVAHRAFQRVLHRLAVPGRNMGDGVFQRARRVVAAADDAQRLVGEIDAVSPAVPFPAANAGQRLGAQEQGTVALEFGDVGEQRNHLVRLVAAGVELRHRGGRHPGQLLAAMVVQAQQRTFDDLARGQRLERRHVAEPDRVATVVDHQPVVEAQAGGHVQAFVQAQDAVGGGIGGQHAAVEALEQHALVDGHQQRVVIELGLAAPAQVARHGDHVAVRAVVEAGRMHFHGELAAVAAGVVHLDHIGFVARERLQHGRHVVGRQLGVDGVHQLAHQLLALAPVGALAGAIEVDDAAVGVDDADRVGHGVEQAVVAAPDAVGVPLQAMQAGQHLGQESRVGGRARRVDQRFEAGDQRIVPRTARIGRQARIGFSGRVVMIHAAVDRASPG